MSESPEAPAERATVRVWLVEDHDLLRKTLLRLCVPTRGIESPRAFGNAEAMLAGLRSVQPGEQPQVLLLDVGLPGRSGLEVIGDVLELAPDCRVVILTVFEDEKKIGEPVLEKYEAEGDPYFGSSALWDDGIIDPAQTREAVGLALAACMHAPVETGPAPVYRM